MSAIIQEFSNLPTPVKVGLGGVAAGGVLVILLTHRQSPTQAAQSAQSGPVVLPAGAQDSNAGEVQQNTLSLVQGLISQSQAATTAAIAASQSTFTDQLNQFNQSNQAALASSQSALQAQQQASNNALTALINALQSTVSGILANGPVQTPNPNGNPPGGNTGGNPGSTQPGPATNIGTTRHLSDVHSWIGGPQKILDWVGGADYGLESVKHGGKGIAAQAGATDYNLGLILPVSYDVNKDTKRFDFSSHPNAESTYSRWARYTINNLQGHPNASQYEAGLAALSRLKSDAKTNGWDLYSGGFDFANVPDNYGKGVYW